MNRIVYRDSWVVTTSLNIGIDINCDWCNCLRRGPCLKGLSCFNQFNYIWHLPSFWGASAEVWAKNPLTKCQFSKFTRYDSHSNLGHFSSLASAEVFGPNLTKGLKFGPKWRRLPNNGQRQLGTSLNLKLKHSYLTYIPKGHGQGQHPVRVRRRSEVKLNWNWNWDSDSDSDLRAKLLQYRCQLTVVILIIRRWEKGTRTGMTRKKWTWRHQSCCRRLELFWVY